MHNSPAIGPQGNAPAPLVQAMDALESFAGLAGALLQRSIEAAGPQHIVVSPGQAAAGQQHLPPIASFLVGHDGGLDVVFPRAQRAGVAFSLLQDATAHVALAGKADLAAHARRFHAALLAASPFLAARHAASPRFAILDFGGRGMAYQTLASVAESRLSLRLVQAVAPRHDLVWSVQGAPRVPRLRQEVEASLSALAFLAPTPLLPFLVSDRRVGDAYGHSMEVHAANARDALTLARLLDGQRRAEAGSTPGMAGIDLLPAWPHGARVWAYPVDSDDLAPSPKGTVLPRTGQDDAARR